jgi:hypothetical protein
MYDQDDAISHALGMSKDDKLYREIGEVMRQRLTERQGGGLNYWTFWTRWAVRQNAVRAVIAITVLTCAFLLFLAFARAEECPPNVQACKVLVLTPEEEQALMQPRGVLDTAREGRPLELGQIAAYFRDRIARAPAGTVPAQPKADVPIPRPRPPEAPKAE